MRRRALALLLLVAPAACGLAFSPGDYREPSEAEAGSNVDGHPNAPETGPINEGGSIDAGPTRTRIALFAGRRDSLPGEPAGQPTITETMLTSIGSDGSLGPITFDAPAPASLWTHAALVGGEMYLQTASGLAHAPFTDHVGGPWIIAGFPTAPELGIEGWIVDSHALLSGRSDTDPSAWTAAFADGGVSGWSKLTSQTTVVRGNARLVRGGDNVYIVGGDTPPEKDPKGASTGHAEVEVAKLNANGELGSFHATASLPVSDGGAFTTFDPVTAASADHLYILGGLTTAVATAPTDVVFAAKIKDAATGDLDPWVVLPKLPQPISGFAAIVTPSWLVIFGGQLAPSAGLAAKTTDAIRRLAIHADGTFGTDWETIGLLPGGRSAIVGVSY